MSVSLPRDLENQLNNFIVLQTSRCLNRYSDKRLREKVKLNFKWINKFTKLHYESRIKRAVDLKTMEVKKAQGLAKDYIGKGFHDFFVTCVDGRNMPTVMFSKPPHVGGVLRTPAGVVTGFMPGQDGNKVFIDYESFVVKRIINLLREKAGGTLFYGLDSHLGCAARAQIHSTEGGQQSDGGVRADILSKMMTAQGILQLRSQLEKAGEKIAEIIPLFFSFDPKNGGVIMGLELYTNEQEVANIGYTDQVLKKLATEKKIIRTIDLLNDQNIVNILTKNVVSSSADFRNHFPQALLSNWQAITDIYKDGKGQVFINIFHHLKKIYKNTNVSEKIIKQKAKFLLKNLVTRFSIAGADYKWPYDSHQEEMVVITDGGYAPFPNIDAFSVFSHDLNSLVSNVKLPIDLIRSFRKNKKIKNPVKNINLTSDDFYSAPVFVSNKSIFRDFQENSWQALKLLNLDNIFAYIDWDDQKTLNWDKSDVQKFIFNVVSDKKVMIEFDDALRLIDGIYELFNRMRLMMKDKHFRQMILNGNVTVVNTLVDHDRMPRYLIQFVI